MKLPTTWPAVLVTARTLPSRSVWKNSGVPLICSRGVPSGAYTNVSGDTVPPRTLLSTSMWGIGPDKMSTFAPSMLTLPYIVFSGIAGQLADRFSKSWLVHARW